MKKKLRIIYNIDGTICPIKRKNEKYENLIPNKDIIEKIREYKKEGAIIVFNTSRNMKSYDGNLGLINANTAKLLLAWLDKWDIPYDEIYYAKPWPGYNGFYVDDRAVRPDEFLKYNEKELIEICSKSVIAEE